MWHPDRFDCCDVSDPLRDSIRCPSGKHATKTHRDAPSRLTVRVRAWSSAYGVR